jgi:hypothetical protein
VSSQFSVSGSDPQALAASVALLQSNRAPKVLILSGLPGSGRRQFLEQLAQSFGAANILQLDLDGFEPIGPGLPAFLEFLLAFERRHDADVQAQLRQVWQPIVSDPAAADSSKWAAVMSLTLGLTEPVPPLRAALGGGARPDAAAVLQACLAEQNGGAPWIVHVPAEVTLPEPLGQWLVRECAGSGSIALAFSCAPPTASDALVGLRRGWCAPLRLEFSPPTLQPSAAGLALRTRIEASLAECEDDAPRLRRFLALALVCGEVAPSLPLMAAAGFSQAEAERCVDQIDDRLCGHDDGPAVFEDLAYRHPGFPGLSVYRFAEPQTRALLREELEPTALASSADELWTFLSTRLGVATRSVAQLFANLGLPEKPDRAAGPLQRLRLWVGPNEVQALQDLLTEDVRAGRLPSEALFGAAQRDATMPAHQRLALLEASTEQPPAAPSGESPGPAPAVVSAGAAVPIDRALATAVLRTELLCALSKFVPAIASAEEAQRVLAAQFSEPAGVKGLIFFLTANCRRRLGQLDQALAAFGAATDEAARPRPDGTVDHHNIGVCLAESGHCHAERGEWSEAIRLLGDALAQLKQAGTDNQLHHEQVAQLERNLAVCQAKLAETQAG